MRQKNYRSDRKSIIKIVIFGILTILSVVMFISGMISNGNNAVKRFNALNAVDQAGGDVETALNELRSYIYSHMNTEIGGPNGIYPPIQLKGTYENLVAIEEARVKDVNDLLYPEAQAFCEANGNQGFSGRNRTECIAEYIEKNGTKIKEIEEDYYKYDFVAPRWSPDLAGYSLIASILFGSATLISLLMYFRTRHAVHIAN